MERYADYEFYAEVYDGRSIPEEAFSGAMLKASAYLNRITFGRIQVPYPEEVRYAVCELAELQHKYDKEARDGNREVKSENNDGYSVTYVTEGTDGESPNVVLHRKMYAAAKVWLGNTGLLYLGGGYMLTNADITIYNRKRNPETKKMEYCRTILKGVHWYTEQKVTVGENGLKSADLYKIRVPMDNRRNHYLAPGEYTALPGANIRGTGPQKTVICLRRGRLSLKSQSPPTCSLFISPGEPW